MTSVSKLAGCLLLLLSIYTNSQAQFLSQIGSTSTVVSNDVALDELGNAYITGGFIGIASFQEPNGAPGASVFSLTSLGLKDIFVAKYNPQGRPLWGFSIGGVAGGPGIDDEGVSIAVSQAGHVFVTGYFQGTANFDPAGLAEVTSQGFRDVFMASYTSDGQFRWVESFGGTADDRGQDVGIKDDEAVYFTGFFRETATLSSDNSGTDAVTSAGEEDGYLISMDQSAGLNWIFGYGNISVDKGNRVATDAAGNVYLLGIFSRDADFDPGDDTQVLSSLSDSQDGVLAAYTSAGALRWANPIGSAQIDGTSGLAVNPAGSAFITGHFIGTVNFDPQNSPFEIISTGIDQYIANYTPAGSLGWVHALGTGFAQGGDIALNDLNQVLVTGFFASEIFPDPQSTLRLTGYGGQDMLLASYESDGLFRWAHAIGGPLGEVPTGVALGNAGEAYLTGFFEDDVDFNPGSATLLAESAGEYDGFLARYGADGSFAVATEEDNALIQDNYSIEVFPNPANNRVAVTLNAATGGPVKLEVLDVLGRLIYTTETHVSRGAKTTVLLEVSDFPAGLYFMRLKDKASKMASITVLR